jgi:protein involved in sex pheromone biosynthesis
MRVAAIYLSLLLSACAPSFDDKYAETEKQLKADADRLDQEMAAEEAKEPGQDN